MATAEIAIRPWLSLRLPNRPQAASIAREALGQLCTRIPSEVMVSARLLVTELVANAVRHSGQGADGWVEIEASLLPHRLRLMISDGGAGFVPQIEPSLERGGGFGLFMVDEIADSWGVHADGKRTDVWIVLDW